MKVLGETSTTITLTNIIGVNGDLVKVQGTSSELEIAINDGNSSDDNDNDDNNNDDNNNDDNNNDDNNNDDNNNDDNNNDGNNNDDNNNDDSNNDDNNGNNNNGNSNNNDNKNTSVNGNLPYAGSSNILGIIILTAVVGIISYVKFKIL